MNERKKIMMATGPRNAIAAALLSVGLIGAGCSSDTQTATPSPKADSGSAVAVSTRPEPPNPFEGRAGFTVAATTATMSGVIQTGFDDDIKDLLTAHPDLERIVLTNAPGSSDDEANLRPSLLIHEAGITTEVLTDSEIASGAVDFFLAGKKRIVADEASLAGHEVCDRTVWKICSENGWWCSFAKKKSRKKSSPGTPAHDDLVRRIFTADQPNELWLTDLTEHRTDEGKLYLCAIKDLWSNRIIGYSIDERMKARLVVAALNNAVARRGDVAGCILHSDRGSQFRARKVHRVLARYEMVGSLGQVGSAGDNAAMESFFSLLQKNVLNTQRWATREQLRSAIVTWIERTYHRHRRQDRLDRLTPIEYERNYYNTA